MITDFGVITAIEKNKEIIIKVTPSAACSSCGGAHICGKKTGDTIKVPYSDGFSVGDKVKVEIENISVVKSSMIIYVIPLAGILAGIYSGYYFLFRSLNEDIKAVLSFIVGIIFTIPLAFLIKRWDKKASSKIRYHLSHTE